MSQTFVDSSAWYAFACKRDQHHDDALKFVTENRDLLLTSNFVFAETLSLLTKRAGKEVALYFGRGIRSSGTTRVLHLDAKMEETAWICFERHRDKDWDFVDCTSFALMDTLKITRAFTFDAHFSQKGYQVFP